MKKVIAVILSVVYLAFLSAVLLSGTHIEEKAICLAKCKPNDKHTPYEANNLDDCAHGIHAGVEHVTVHKTFQHSGLQKQFRSMLPNKFAVDDTATPASPHLFAAVSTEDLSNTPLFIRHCVLLI
ncbi:hypothetical protein EXU57_02770 [Segetibacter sp. 3557_3]|uniref:hypothetical protein n=1 Tax=Segetibacter sp. 3557_3 TaxID=2547429 RepID=UPI001058AAE1|nr:hypothetical protein [Segetibacter sp. 3557_3]TDH29014.1 hypothetical protein EXU57_02770 [Segetibacter sp. 3557_3]